MQVNNPDHLKNAYIATRVQSNYLIARGFALFFHENSKYYYVNTKELQEALQHMPKWLNIIKF